MAMAQAYSRKRAYSADDETDAPTGAVPSAPSFPTAKRVRQHTAPSTPTHPPITGPGSSTVSSAATHRMLAKYLSILDKDQLVSILLDLAQSANSDQAVALHAAIPKPTIAAVAAHLTRLERDLRDAFPYSRTGPIANDYAYARVAPVLETIKDAVVDFLEYFYAQAMALEPAESKLDRIATLFEYLALAINMVVRLPDWENASHRRTKANLVSSVREAWHAAIHHVAQWAHEQARYMAPGVVEAWGKCLTDANAMTGGQLTDVVRDFAARLGWYFGIAPPPVAVGAPCAIAAAPLPPPTPAPAPQAPASFLFSTTQPAFLSMLAGGTPGQPPSSPASRSPVVGVGPRVQFGMGRQ
ncbi:Tethering factor for nuclear proteasome sts1 [Allomyces javanicus]|nr:Tethering factor for nuclear proteasome sts1 [Allomyces javanicus]